MTEIEMYCMHCGHKIVKTPIWWKVSAYVKWPPFLHFSLPLKLHADDNLSRKCKHRLCSCNDPAPWEP